MRMNALWSVRVACLVFFLNVVLLGSADTLADECDIRLGESRVDFGRILRPNSSSTTGFNDLHDVGQRSLNMTASCDSVGELELIIRGETLANAFRFSRSGKVFITAKNALLDGRSVHLSTLKANGSGAGSHGPSVEIGPGDTLIPVLNGLPVEGRIWSLMLEIRPKIPLSDLRTADAKTPESNLSVEIRQR